MENNIERVLEWDDEIEKENGEWLVLPEGDYDFEVVSFERGRHEGSAKLPACPKAIITLGINAPEGYLTLIHNLFLHSKCEGMLSAFFCAIGQKKHGERLKMNWGTVTGTTGRCKLGVRKYTKKDGDEGIINEIKEFYDKEPAEQTQPNAGGFIPGQF